MKEAWIFLYKTGSKAIPPSAHMSGERSERLQAILSNLSNKMLHRGTLRILFLCGVICGLLLLPHTQQEVRSTPVLPARGGVDLPQHPLLTCDHPADLFKMWHLPVEKLPKKEALALLSRHEFRVGISSNPQAVTQPDLTYDPQKDMLCAASAATLYTQYVQPQPTAFPTTQSTQVTTSTASSSSWSSQWVSGILHALWVSIAQSLGSALQGAIQWANKLEFMFTTPQQLTYGHGTVVNLYNWVLGVVDSGIVLLLVIAGYNHMFGRSQDLREWVPTLIYIAIATNLSLFILGQVIELHNELCRGLMSVLATLGLDKTSVFWGTIKWVEIPAYVSCAYLLELITALLLMLQMLLRIALLNLLIVLAPLGMICFAMPQTKAWGQLWAQAFASTLIVQFLQLLCISLGSALIASAHITLDIVSPLVGLSALYLAFKIPGMLLSNVLRASHGDGGKGFMQAIQTVAQYIAMVG